MAHTKLSDLEIKLIESIQSKVNQIAWIDDWMHKNTSYYDNGRYKAEYLGYTIIVDKTGYNYSLTIEQGAQLEKINTYCRGGEDDDDYTIYKLYNTIKTIKDDMDRTEFLANAIARFEDN